jgi:hypothetical protein
MALLRWLRDWAGVVVVVVGAAAAWLLRRRGARAPAEKVALEFAAIEAAKDARKMQNELGHQRTLDHVRARYVQAYRQTLARDAQKIAELEKCPDLLAKRLARTGLDRELPRAPSLSAPTVDHGVNDNRGNGGRIPVDYGLRERHKGGDGSV